MKQRTQLTFKTVCLVVLVSVTSICNAQTITASFSQKIAQYDVLDSFSSGLARVKKNGKYGFIDKAGNEIIPCTYENVGTFHDQMAWVLDSKYGYVDNMGELIIPCKYTKAQNFSEGLAWVNDDGPWRCIDNNDKVVFTLELMSERRSDFKDGLSIITPPEGESSIINSKGEILKLSGYSWLGNGISDELILCEDNDEESGETKYVYLDKKGNVVIDCPPNGDMHFPFYNGLAPVIKCEWVDENARRWDKVGYIDKTGKFIIPPTLPFYGITNVDESPFYCFDGMIRTVKDFGDEDSLVFLLKFGFVDKTGKLVIPYKYDDAHDFSGGLAAVCDNNGKWGFIDKKGNIIIPFKYDGVSWDSFQDGFALVMMGDKFGYVDKQGNDTFSVK